MADSRRDRRVSAGRMLAATAASVISLTILASPADAQTTHKFLNSFPTTTTNPAGDRPVVQGVDGHGNIYVWQSPGVLAKYGPNGAPSNFSALGSNVLDGAGGHNCATMPADCDRVPSGGFEYI